MALNYRRLRDRGRAKWWLVGCIVGTLALIAVGLCLPAGFPSTGLGVGALVGMQRAAKDQLGERIRRHVASGGKTEPWYKAVAIGLLSGLVVFGLIFVVLLAARDARS